jgi:CHAD domain-containing protein
MKSIRKYTQHLFSTLVQNLEEFQRSRSFDTLHKIRVNVKKIKAIILLLHFFDPKFKFKKNFLLFRSIFRKAGEIRDPEVMARLFLKYNITGMEEVPANTKVLVSDFIKSIPGYKAAVNKKESKFRSSINRIKKDQLVAYLKRNRKKIKSGLHPKVVLPTIHKTRKQIKEVIYLSESIGNARKEKTINFYRKVEEEIGALHDLQTLVSVLSRTRNFIDNQILQKIEEDCRKSVRRLKSQTSRFYS